MHEKYSFTGKVYLRFALTPFRTFSTPLTSSLSSLDTIGRILSLSRLSSHIIVSPSDCYSVVEAWNWWKDLSFAFLLILRVPFSKFCEILERYHIGLWYICIEDFSFHLLPLSALKIACHSGASRVTRPGGSLGKYPVSLVYIFHFSVFITL
jgi:hypothetical protein